MTRDFSVETWTVSYHVLETLDLICTFCFTWLFLMSGAPVRNEGCLYCLKKFGGRRLTSKAEIPPVDHLQRVSIRPYKREEVGTITVSNMALKWEKRGFITCPITRPPCHMTRAGTCIRITCKARILTRFCLWLLYGGCAQV